MAKVLVFYFSMYGHIEIMATAVAEGAHIVLTSGCYGRRLALSPKRRVRLFITSKEEK